MKMRLVAATVAAGLAASITGIAPATADVFKIDQFNVVSTYNSVSHTILNDGFDDNLPPPEAPGTANVFTHGNCASSTDCYATNGTFTESNSRAVLDTSLGSPFPLTPSTPTLLESATLETNVDPTTVYGLKENNGSTFFVSGRFDLGLPSTSGTQYGVSLSDLGYGGAGTDTLTMAVANVGGTVQVEFHKYDFQNGSDTLIAATDLQPILDSLASSSMPPITPDQIELTLARNDAATNDITASFSLLQAGGDVYDQTLLTPLQLAPDATVFNSESWTLPTFYALQAVPEPMSLVLFGFGLAGLGFVRRRRSA